ncbi:hypothetical protein BCR43DRAFT_41239 [Syncephalastrum racemosum]|uniref:Uncharacterized protein n=1 Tax=Syncephalastrum racemosum TaxID=13706 RepID=A0A1X2HUJ1_SYNRA|nr:hypothetical protein BCR43DRAFT_41239 [Syncephalastrum racemosum]
MHKTREPKASHLCYLLRIRTQVAGGSIRARGGSCALCAALLIVTAVCIDFPGFQGRPCVHTDDEHCLLDCVYTPSLLESLSMASFGWTYAYCAPSRSCKRCTSKCL